ncbi:hypothetical protein F5879DRAFT_1037488 [Lentinula edodes]|nr:hypothetical protein F5879DRAFT_1037488 [Lentinula edodes]
MLTGHKQSRRVLSSLSFALLAVLTFCSPAVRAEESNSEYGTVIGIDLGTTYE